MRFARTAETSIERHRFPATTTELIDAYGEVEIRLPDGAVTVAELLDHLPDEVLETEEDARLVLYGSFGEAAIGRKAYSDRDPPNVADQGYEPVSL